MSMTILDESLKTWETKFNVNYGHPAGRDHLIQAINKEIGFANGKWRNRHSGVEVNDLEAFITTKARTTGLTKQKNFGTRYVSPFQKRSEDRAAEHASRTRDIMKREIENSRIVFKSATIKEKVLDLFSENFLAGDEQDGIMYRKVFDGSIPSPKSWNLDQLLKETGVTEAYIDQNKTAIQQSLYNHELKTMAEKIIIGQGGDPKNESLMTRAIASLKTAENGLKVGKTIAIYPERELQEEFLKKILIEEWKDPSKLTLQETNVFNSRAATEVERINSLDAIKQSVTEIAIPVPTTNWEF